MFRTELKVTASSHKLNIKDPVLTLGSCFADNTGKKLQEFKFDVLANPFGTIFNPISIFKLLQLALSGQPLREDGFVHHKDIWFHHDLHSEVSALEKEQLIERFDFLRQTTLEYLQKSRVMILTFGTAIVYEQKTNGAPVANCHKIPANHFNRKFLDIEAITQGFEQLYHAIKQENPQLWFVVTVSPVRHIRDTLEQNNVSKSMLRLAADQFTQKYADAVYFPAFEIMMDDLRDYRFYADDMLHPSEAAIGYIWEKFSAMFFDEVTLDFVAAWQKILKSLGHKAFHPNSEGHQEFLKKMIKQMEGFQGLVDIEPELQSLNKQLIASK